MTKFKLSGTDEQLGNFWAVCLSFANSMPTHECLFTSSWPFAGNRKLGMCIAVNDRVKNVSVTLRVIAKACGVELSEYTAHDERLADEIRRIEHGDGKSKPQFGNDSELKDCKEMLNLTCTGMDVERLRRLSK